MPGRPPGRSGGENSVRPGYLFYGEEMFPARQFVQDLQSELAPAEGERLEVEKFVLREVPWRDVIDAARVIPLFFSPWRLLLVESGGSEDEAPSPDEAKSLKDYFLSPVPKTVIVVLGPAKLPKSHPLLKLFASLPSGAVEIKEFKTIKGPALTAWVLDRLSSRGKRASSEAIELLLEMTGTNLQRLANELDKVATYVGEKKVVDAQDVERASDWVRSYFDWELAAALEKADFEQSLVIINKRFQERDEPVSILYSLAAFFRDLQVAKSGLKEKRDRKDIFRELRPRIRESMGSFYRERLNEFFGVVEGLRQKDLTRILARLEAADLKIKSSDASAQALFETLIYEYCRLRAASGVPFTSKARS